MPTYHYRCKNCNYDFTEQQSFTDDPITVCPECGEEQVRKVYSAVPVSLQTRRARGPSFRSRRCAQTRMWPAVHQGMKKGHHACMMT